ncbi:Gfo/Idh/MocA family oxidoreductase [Sabulilitoribacter multivorans]|uniref:Gfo/Idh/MocA family oxidoreductase n=1 Tax=Flaviramulus multivorans TaxID=1304750 RepID=A0ABS9IFR2_9FLAO|nr:Gfo/Idh/MocA family oxidoreductase [Flaviramulus multivorans]MCF7559601.1 Gfo/Idh/MocA family oxidoreductase [Flaviramulus multivorans]
MNWGILGCANIAISAVIPAILRTDNNAQITIGSRDYEKAKKAAEEFRCNFVTGYNKLLAIENIEAVYIPLPTGLHFEWVKKAVLEGKHVLVEKSATNNYTEAKELIELAKQKKVAIVENFQFQHHSQHQYVFDLLEKGEIGEIRAFRSSFGFPPFSEDSNIRYKKELGGGALLDSGAYVLKATSFIMGEGFEVKSAFLKTNKVYNVDWFGGAFLVNKSKEIFSEVAFGFDNFYQCNYEIWGSNGKITSTRAFTAKPDFNPTIILEKQGFYEEIELPKDDHFGNMISYFMESINEKTFSKEWNNILVQAKLIEDVRKLSGI